MKKDNEKNKNMLNKLNKLKNWLFLGLIGFFLVVAIKYSGILPPKTSYDFITQDIKNLFQSHPYKAKQWQKMEKEVSSWGDALGMKIDPDIKKIVIVLNLLGFKTSASCEGHLDRALSYPWIDFDIKDNEIDELTAIQQNLYRNIEEKRFEIQKKQQDLSLADALREENESLNNLYQDSHAINDKIETLAKLKLQPLRDLIINFYKHHPINLDTLITIHGLNITFYRMYSLGGDWQIIRDENKKKEKLKEYQKEMQMFADFLTRYYFNK